MWLMSLAALGACKAFDAADDAPTLPDASSSGSSPDAAEPAPDGAAVDGSTPAVGFCARPEDTDVVLCEDFENNDLSKYTSNPLPPFVTIQTGPTPNGDGTSIHFRITEPSYSVGELGALTRDVTPKANTPVSKLTLTYRMRLATVDQFAFSRLTGFFAVHGGSNEAHAPQLFGSGQLTIDAEENDKPADGTFRPMLNTWYAVRIVLWNDGGTFRRETFVSEELIASVPITNPNSGALYLKIGTWQTGEDTPDSPAKELDVWYDDVLLRRE